jgi:hypothetical protein
MTDNSFIIEFKLMTPFFAGEPETWTEGGKKYLLFKLFSEVGDATHQERNNTFLFGGTT